MAKIWFHHINLTSDQTEEMASFYTDVVGLGSIDELNSRVFGDTYRHGAHNRFVGDGTFQFHLAKPDYDLPARSGQPINPVHRGHIAFRTDDIETVKKSLDDHGIPYSDYGVWAMAGWHQVFFHDPAGNVVEVHQVVDPQYE